MAIKILRIQNVEKCKCSKCKNTAVRFVQFKPYCEEHGKQATKDYQSKYHRIYYKENNMIEYYRKYQKTDKAKKYRMDYYYANIEQQHAKYKRYYNNHRLEILEKRKKNRRIKKC